MSRLHPHAARQSAREGVLVSCPHFTTEKVRIEGSHRCEAVKGGQTIIVLEGEAEIGREVVQGWRSLAHFAAGIARPEGPCDSPADVCALNLTPPPEEQSAGESSETKGGQEPAQIREGDKSRTPGRDFESAGRKRPDASSTAAAFALGAAIFFGTCAKSPAEPVEHLWLPGLWSCRRPLNRLTKDRFPRSPSEPSDSPSFSNISCPAISLLDLLWEPVHGLARTP